MLKRIKYTFDPKNVFNKGKIVDAFPMDKSLRYEIDRKEPDINTFLDFSDSLGILRASEKCNGSGDCRKTENAGGTMCPSYRATLDEKDSTRARANALREFLTNSEQENKFNHSELKEVFDLCLSCKACASECPSNVDVANFKAEFLFQYQEENGYSFRSKFIANSAKYNKIASKFPGLYNAISQNPFSALFIKKIIGFHPKRSLPKVYKGITDYTDRPELTAKELPRTKGTLYLFIDEFTNFLEPKIAKDAIYLFENLGYHIKPISKLESARAQLSKGFLKEAKQIADHNISFLKTLISNEVPLVGIEPSAILGFRDEYLRLATNKEAANKIAKNTYTLEEFLQKEILKGNILSSQFTTAKKTIKIHGHCHQKALSSMAPTFAILNLPKRYQVTIINSGCCGMAGSFGYEKEHYELSMQVGEQSLFSKIRKFESTTEICASGTSCRHQIYDGTNKISKHPVTLLKEALL